MVALSYRLEVVTLPVADVDRSVAFYADGLGFALDVDYEPTPGFRVVQLTPPSYYDIGEQRGAAWSYRDAWPEVDGVSIWSPSRRTRSRSTSTADECTSSRARASCLMASTVASTPTRS